MEWELQLQADPVARDARCALLHMKAGTAPRRLVLDLRPPCHLLRWRNAPPPVDQQAAAAGSRPVGAIHDAMAWRLPSRKGSVVVAAVIGDPLSDRLQNSALGRLRAKQGMHCAASVQGVLVSDQGLQVAGKRDQVTVLCDESGLELQDFHLLLVR